jgi:ribosome-interacting GTPase 1
MHYPDEAIEQFQKVLKLDPKNKDARTYHDIAKKKVAEYRVREKKIYGKFALSSLIN